MYDAASGQRVCHVSPIKVTAPVRACGLSPDCRHLVAAIGKGFIFRCAPALRRNCALVWAHLSQSGCQSVWVDRWWRPGVGAGLTGGCQPAGTSIAAESMSLSGG